MSGRLRGVGTLARVVTITAAALVVPSAIGTFLSGERDPLYLTLTSLFCSFLAVGAVRSRFLGLWLEEDRVTARTWWRTIRIPRGDLTSCISADYWGGFTEGWRVQYLRELELGTSSYLTYTLSGSIAFSPKSLRQRAAVLEYIDDTQRR